MSKRVFPLDCFVTAFLAMTLFLPVLAHKPSESFLNINASSQALSVKWQVAIRDLDYLMNLDQNTDGMITGLEFKSQKSQIIEYLYSKLKLEAFSKPVAEPSHEHKHSHSHAHHSSLHSDTAALKTWIGAYCKRSEQVDLMVEKHDQLTYAVLLLDYQCGRYLAKPSFAVDVAQKKVATATNVACCAKDKLGLHERSNTELDKLKLDYNLLFDEDPEHRALVSVTYEDQTQSYALGKDQRHITAKLGKVDYKYQFFNFLDQGKWHIWTGFDHILFLLALLLPAVFISKKRELGIKPVLWTVFKIVTAFTIAHSLTLSLAALEIIQVDSRLIEILIALSVAITALYNLFPLFSLPHSLFPFVFGLIHGFGFAGALQDLGLPLNALLVSLFSFNFGVELGQMVIVVVFVPIAYWLRNTWFYQVIVFRLGSLVILIMALWWLFERL